VAQVVGDLAQLLDRLVGPGHLGEGERLLGVVDAPCPGATEGAKRARGLRGQEKDHEDVSHDQHRKHGAQRLDDALERLGLHSGGHLGRLEHTREPGAQCFVAAREVDPVPVPPTVGADDTVVGRKDRGRANLALLDKGYELVDAKLTSWGLGPGPVAQDQRVGGDQDR